ncbi:MAG: hydrogen peroxide-inducible genes activator [Planctomycetota bacterium]
MARPTSKPSLRQLESFIAVAESVSFRRTAARLGLSQPTLSNQIAALERCLGLRLLERGRPGSTLTPAGRELLASARRVVEEYRGFIDGAESMTRGPTGTHRLGVTPTLGPYLLPHVLPEVHRKYAALKLYVRESAPRELETALAGGEHDVVLTALPVESDMLTVLPLFREHLRLVVAADHRLADQRQVAPSELAGEAVLTLEEHHLFRWQVERLCDSLGAHVLRDFEGTSLDTLRHMVAMGMGISFLPAFYVASEIRDARDLVVKTLDGEEMHRDHALVWRSTSPNSSLYRSLGEDVRRIVRAKLRSLAVVMPLR